MEVDMLDYAIGEVLLIETSCIIVKISQWDGKKLWNP